MKILLIECENRCDVCLLHQDRQIFPKQTADPRISNTHLDIKSKQKHIGIVVERSSLASIYIYIFYFYYLFLIYYYYYYYYYFGWQILVIFVKNVLAKGIFMFLNSLFFEEKKITKIFH
jgi:hypothetical protein